MVLNTPLTAFAAHERYAVFFRPDFVICGRVACIPKNSLMTKVAGRLLAVFKYLTTPLNMGFMNKTNRTSIMKTISAENLPLIAHNQIPVVTTELLAQLYGTETANIKMNFSRNTKRFVQGKHFFKLEGDDLREFKHSMSLRPSVSDEVTESYPVKIARNVRSLILWTERGAARHAKMLETDQAWEVFEKLEDCYFSQKQPATTRQVEPAVDMLNIDILIQIRDGNVKDIRQIGPDMFIGKVDQILSGLRESGWIVIKRDLLAEKLATW